MTSKDRFSILFGHRFDNYVLQVLHIGGPFAVLTAVQDEWVCFLLKSLSHVHHAVFSFLVLLQRNPVVDSLVLEHLLTQLEERYEPTPHRALAHFDPLVGVVACA